VLLVVRERGGGGLVWRVPIGAVNKRRHGGWSEIGGAKRTMPTHHTRDNETCETDVCTLPQNLFDGRLKRVCGKGVVRRWIDVVVSVDSVASNDR